MEEKDEVSYCLIYDILCFQKDSELLRAWHEELLPLKEKFSENTYNSMIQAFFRHKLFGPRFNISDAVNQRQTQVF